MTATTCPGCGAPETRTLDTNGRPMLNLSPITGLCVDCTVKAAAESHTFHSRREDRKGDVVDTKALAARNDE